MAVDFREGDAVALALGVWGVAAALPHLLWLLKHDCVASCIESYPGSGDILLITQFSQEVAGGGLFSHPDPFLRYPPIAMAIWAGDFVGPFEAVTVVVGYAWVWEFVVVPVALYLAVRWVAGGWAGAAAVLALILTTHASLAFPWPPAAFGAGNYQYALGIPSALLAIAATSWDDRGIWTGLLLGITANVQVAIALLAALTVAAKFALEKRWRVVATAAVTLIVVAAPTFYIYATSYTAGQTRGRAMTLAGALTVIALVFFALVIVYAARSEIAVPSWVVSPFLIASILCGVVVVAGVIDGGWWYPYVGGYVGHLVLAGAAGSVARDHVGYFRTD